MTASLHHQSTYLTYFLRFFLNALSKRTKSMWQLNVAK